jgi:hypothetical protein
MSEKKNIPMTTTSNNLSDSQSHSPVFSLPTVPIKSTQHAALVEAPRLQQQHENAIQSWLDDRKKKAEEYLRLLVESSKKLQGVLCRV